MILKDIAYSFVRLFCKSKAGDSRKYKDMILSDSAKNLLTDHPKKFASYCNGVGSKTGIIALLTYHLTPNTIGFIDVTPASDVHDVDFTIPSHFDTIHEAEEWFHESNDRYEANLKTLIARRDDRLNRYRKWVIWFQVDFCLNSEKGWNSFLKGKTIGHDFYK